MPRGVYVRTIHNTRPKGYKFSEQAKASMSAKNYRRGKKFTFTEEHRINLSKALKGKSTWSKGTKQSPEWIAKRVQARIENGTTQDVTAPKGEKHYLWIKDRTVALDSRRMDSGKKWSDWRKAVFARDKYTCQDCGVSKVYIEPHHIIPKRIALEKIYDINNGVTLCRPCHLKTFGKESDFAEKYSAIITAQM